MRGGEFIGWYKEKEKMITRKGERSNITVIVLTGPALGNKGLEGGVCIPAGGTLHVHVHTGKVYSQSAQV